MVICMAITDEPQPNKPLAEARGVDLKSASRATEAFVRTFWAFCWRGLLVVVVHSTGKTVLLWFLCMFVVAPILSSLGYVVAKKPIIGLFSGQPPFLKFDDAFGGRDTRKAQAKQRHAASLDAKEADLVSPESREWQRALREQTARMSTLFKDRGRSQTSERLPKLAIIDKASAKGKITGYEPNAMKELPLPHGNLYLYGNPGSGLESSNFDDKSIELGMLGEVNFAKALEKLGILEKNASYWSVNRPDFNGTLGGADVDCVILTANTLWLLDMKYYPGGDMTYYSYGNLLLAIDNQTGSQVGEVRKMTRNMEAAELVFKVIAKGYDVEVKSAVVLIPTHMGSARVGHDAQWPGNVPIMTLPDFIERIQSEQVYDNKSARQRRLSAMLQGLVKK